MPDQSSEQITLSWPDGSVVTVKPSATVSVALSGPEPVLVLQPGDELHIAAPAVPAAPTPVAATPGVPASAPTPTPIVHQ